MTPQQIDRAAREWCQTMGKTPSDFMSNFPGHPPNTWLDHAKLLVNDYVALEMAVIIARNVNRE